MASREFTLPALYCVTLCWVCFLQSRPLQYVLRVLGTLTWKEMPVSIYQSTRCICHVAADLEMSISMP